VPEGPAKPAHCLKDRQSRLNACRAGKAGPMPEFRDLAGSSATGKRKTLIHGLGTGAAWCNRLTPYTAKSQEPR